MGYIWESRNFNPRSREGSDQASDSSYCRTPEFQSTLPRGERRPSIFFDKSMQTISIHAPARGATAPDTFRLFVSYDISIHAPARGATLPESYTFHWYVYFNPRSREGSDGAVDEMDFQIKEFQSTLPRGERQSCSKECCTVG